MRTSSDEPEGAVDEEIIRLLWAWRRDGTPSNRRIPFDTERTAELQHTDCFPASNIDTLQTPRTREFHAESERAFEALDSDGVPSTSVSFPPLLGGPSKHQTSTV